MTTLGDENIRRLDVAMNNVPWMSGIESVGDLNG